MSRLKPARAPGLLARRAEIDLGQLRIAGAAMLGAGAVLPLLGHPGPGCALRALTGIPCPLCGMSTSVESTLRLDLGDALATNPMGVAAVVVALSLIVHRGRRRLAIPAWTIPACLALMWIWQLVRFSVL